MTVKWVLGGMPESPRELAHLMTEALPLPLKGLFAGIGLLG